MMSASNEPSPIVCFFASKYECDNKDDWCTAGPTRIRTIREYSQNIHKDELFKSLDLDKNPELTLSCHRTCVSTYTSKHHAKRKVTKRQSTELCENVASPKKTRQNTGISHFKFQENCLFCGEACNVNKDRKNPSRWRPAYLFRKITCSKYKISSKVQALNICNERNDDQSKAIKQRVLSAISDLHAADARYHHDCRKEFYSIKSTSAATTSAKQKADDEHDEAFEAVTQMIYDQTDKMWTSIELQNLYADQGGRKLNRKQLITNLSETFGDELLVLTSPGICSILVLRSKASKLMKLAIVENDEELLRNILNNKTISDQDDLFVILDELATQSDTTKLWVDVLIRPVFLMMEFVRAEREADWPLHLSVFRKMLPYYFAAGHANYARYGLLYLREMESLPEHISAYFMKGEHVTRHMKGFWNGIWSDMFIETTFMRYGHSAGGIIGITLKPETLKIWALSLHTCSQLESDLQNMVEEKDSTATQNKHKEESKARIANDASDREGIRKKLELCVNPLDPKQHPKGLLNIVTGKISPTEVNAQNAVDIGGKQLEEFEKSWPTGFYEPISRKVKTMNTTKKHLNVGKTKVYDINLIYSRVIGLQASSRDINIDSVLQHELSPIPTSMFEESGDMRTGKTKADLKNKMKVETSARTIGEPDKKVIDGSALLWAIHWPANGNVNDYISNVKDKLERELQKSDVFLVFDRYCEYSIKSSTRTSRAAECSRVHQLSINTPLPARNVILTVSENKKQLIHLIVNSIIEDSAFQNKNTQTHKLVITGEDNIPTEINKGIMIKRRDMETSYEEADNIIIQQVLTSSAEGGKHISVLCEDTDVFVLLCYYCDKLKLQCKLSIEPLVKERTSVDIVETVKKHQNIVNDLPAAHALTGCDTVAGYFGIGKATVLKTLQSGKYPLTSLGDKSASMDVITKQATMFVAACYGKSYSMYESLSKLRTKLWATKYAKAGKGQASAPKLASLPPTDEAFRENIKRAHYQVCLWKSLDQTNAPSLNPEQYGWVKEEATKSLQPVTVHESVPLIPDSVLKLIRCSCKSQTPCKTSGKCSCRQIPLPCTIFCSCHENLNCLNKH